MFSIFYKRYKLLFWVVVFLLLATGTISKMSRGRILEVYLDGSLALIALIMVIISLRKRKE